jgi:hypothetical protein
LAPKSTAKNAEPSAMTYEVTHFPSLAQARMRLAMEAEGMKMEDLRVAAEEAQIDTEGVKTKGALVEAVKSGARGAQA